MPFSAHVNVPKAVFKIGYVDFIDMRKCFVYI